MIAGYNTVAPFHVIMIPSDGEARAIAMIVIAHNLVTTAALDDIIISDHLITGAKVSKALVVANASGHGKRNDRVY